MSWPLFHGKVVVLKDRGSPQNIKRLPSGKLTWPAGDLNPVGFGVTHVPHKDCSKATGGMIQ